MNVTHWMITKTMTFMVTVPVTGTEVLLWFISCITVLRIRYYLLHNYFCVGTIFNCLNKSKLV